MLEYIGEADMLLGTFLLITNNLTKQGKLKVSNEQEKQVIESKDVGQLDEGQLIPFESLGLAPPNQIDLPETLTKTSSYLPQIRVYGSESGLVKEGKFPMGHFGLYHSATQIVDLGTVFNCINIYARPRASVVMGEQPISYYKFESVEFQELLVKAQDGVAGYLAGLEYLLWLPSVKTFSLFLMGNKTLRRESANMKALIGRAATAEIKLIKTAKYIWHGCNIYPCSTPFDLPDLEEMQLQVEAFKNPKDSEIELADGPTSSRVR